MTTSYQRWILRGVERRTRTLPADPAAAAALLQLDEFGGAAGLLTPYVPRFLIEWVRESPETPYRPVDGSLAFVDISGFTALTEQLARRGSIGSEVMRDTLDGVFRALLDEAYDWGAGLLKWGGTRCCSSSTATSTRRGRCAPPGRCSGRSSAWDASRSAAAP